jgi:hypothetical protein
MHSIYAVAAYMAGKLEKQAVHTLHMGESANRSLEIQSIIPTLGVA